jgi:myosin heavy subunit
VAYYLGLQQGDLERALLNRTIVAGGESVVKFLTADEACLTREALAKVIYAKNFQRIITLLNQSLNSPVNQVITVGVLDIYGFESKCPIYDW